MNIRLAGYHEYYKAYYLPGEAVLYIGRYQDPTVEELVDIITHETLHHVLFKLDEQGAWLLLDNSKPRSWLDQYSS